MATKDPIVYMIVVGTRAELDSGKGEVALSLTDAASVLGFSESKLRDLIRTGDIPLAPVAWVGKRALYRASDVDAVRKGR